MPKPKTLEMLTEFFVDIEDPRKAWNQLHTLDTIVTIAICGLLSGADNWVAVANYAKIKADWLRTFLDLSNGTPSHDTLSRFFAALDPKKFQSCFLRWVQEIFPIPSGEVIAVDGKASRRSHQRKKNVGPLHMVSAWACKARLVLGQIRTADKSNEIAAIPELLRAFDLEGAIVTIDAAGCQRGNAQLIVDGGGDYVFGLKGNQGTLHRDVEDRFTILDLATESGKKIRGVKHAHAVSKDKDHGRQETRVYDLLEDHLFCSQYPEWKGLRTCIRVTSTRLVDGETTTDRRYYISSLDADPKRLPDAIRSHWGIENSLHWVLDLAFDEDQSRSRKDNAGANAAVLRHIALNLLRQETTAKCGVKTKRLRCGWDNDYLLQVLAPLRG